MLANKLLGGGSAVEANYIEDVFSTYLYTGNGSAQTITNDIDLAGKGGLVWIRGRSSASNSGLTDTNRGYANSLTSNLTSAQNLSSAGRDVTAFGSSGFNLGTSQNYSSNTNAETYASWTFRKQPKFFDVVTYTGDGVAGRQITHNLGSVPGCMIVKRLDTAWDWFVWHRSLGASNNGDSYMELNTTSPENRGYGKHYWGNGTTYITPTSTNFTVSGGSAVNVSGGTYVAYLFAHDAGGFGLTGTDNVISCGSYVGNGSLNGPTITLGYEPQWLLIKRSSGVANWILMDNMRGAPIDSATPYLVPNTSQDEYTTENLFAPQATGFQVKANDGTINATGSTYIYIAIRKGPMKVPTDATKVFSNRIRTGNGAITQVTGLGFPPDLAMSFNRDGSFGKALFDKLRGQAKALVTSSTVAEINASDSINSFNMDGVTIGADSNGYSNFDPYPYVYEYLRRAPGFFDEVCYTGTGTTLQTLNHNLTVQPELVIIRKRSSAQDWRVVSTKTPNPFSPSNPWWDEFYLNTTGAVQQNVGYINNLAVTTFEVAGATVLNQSGTTYVAYLFATCPGVSKVGNYTGNGSSQTIGCGFTGGARFVLIKRTDSTGDWYVWDTARGIVSANDKHLSLNTTAAEVTTDDSVDPASTGFIVNQLTATNINVTSASYIFLAIA
jgi:hypothetical protein